MSGIQFWFDFASTYSYPAAMQIRQLKDEYQFSLHPFLLGTIFQKQGLNDSPFNVYPVKGQYMWRDMQRICEKLKIELNRPEIFPQNGLLAARISCQYAQSDWIFDFICEVYQANFVHGKDISQIKTIENILENMQLDSQMILDTATTAQARQALKQNGIQAEQLNIFGSPSFIVNGELFWGNDRLKDALDWSKRTG
ncbi:2-hydroxychromene-2-carboxylate isomerase [Acinetobacter ursingii]|uniref:2-hydroxychromene-2-carboxylate isomerase n=2 Tax=Acinetobacter TaxID=469 RepID=N9BYT3_9GAMM|nr:MULTISPECIES: 2-hydroxychromene-2-carboxylate isomerase [Acinetobacter]ENV78426.1 hypothetical protein F942_02757 [Acinetobacter ursingii ANC 3649]MDG9949960.1 2-hydroxychromene-2-carboxylate isomerase [Acinetobacter ursingii]MEC6125850.1 2-hydroxychromene-2-carboxylate isomerase [Acinetobacter ursingii]QXZ24114.1 2-hydroxychromene-2-carboxylate isomerase [Acinetobacter septicus]RSC23643.1 2-hydroxychromene-2-carboxylate isomerase [Acinetobacter sp. FDAARGOS_515]